MTDLSTTIIAKSDQLNSDDLISGPITIRITKVSANPSSAEQPISIHYDGDNGKPYKPCKSMRRVLVQIWGKDGSAFVGRHLTLYRDSSVTWGGLAVGGIRISHMSDIDSNVTMALTATRASRKPYTVKPLVIEKAPTQQKKPEPEPRTLEESTILLRAAASITNGTATQRLGEMWAGLSKEHKAALKPMLDGQLKAQAKSADDAEKPQAPVQEAAVVSDPWLEQYDAAPEQPTQE